MKDSKPFTIIFVGSGAIATSLGNILASKGMYRVILLSIEEEVVRSINDSQINSKYFPNILLNPSLQATVEKGILKQADLVFLALPSVAVVDYLRKTHEMIPINTPIVNLAKGFGNETQIIPECIENFMSHVFVTMKGPSFAREIIYRQPTAFTIASQHHAVFNLFNEIFDQTTIHLDFSNDVAGVEYASILKNIYAIIIGIVDANFDSPNLRSLVLSKAINEMRKLITTFGGQEETIFNYCGFGDFSLTALNDLSRNRTLGLLIGKGFFTHNISDKVVLEGRIATQIFMSQLMTIRDPFVEFPLIAELYKVFNEDYDIKKFVNRILI